MATITISSYSSPCGKILLGSLDGKLCLCDWNHDGIRPMVRNRFERMLGATLSEGHSAVIDMAKQQLDEYFSAHRTTFDIPLMPVGTDFQRRVWQQLLAIPYGTTISYATLAQLIGQPRAVRAVASANRANAISIFIPCHRVIGSDGSIVGYSGGKNTKMLLLDLEKQASRK